MFKKRVTVFEFTRPFTDSEVDMTIPKCPHCWVHLLHRSPARRTSGTWSQKVTEHGQTFVKQVESICVRMVVPDTGSPCSLICESRYQKLFDQRRASTSVPLGRPRVLVRVAGDKHSLIVTHSGVVQVEFQDMKSGRWVVESPRLMTALHEGDAGTGMRRSTCTNS